VSNEHRIPAADGRGLFVHDAGDPDGRPIVFHNGTPGSRLPYGAWVDDAGARGIRFLSYDRPGYGGSDPHPGRTVADAAADVSAIADALGIERLAVWGLSGGGPHTLACAALLPGRVAAAATIASVAPYPADGIDWFDGMGKDNIEEFNAALKGREAVAPMLEAWADDLAALPPEALAAHFRSLLSAADAAVLTGEYAEYVHAAMREGLAPGVEGWLEDDLAFTRDWGFDLADIRVPMQLWQGREDRFVPFAHGEWLAERIPGVDARLSDEDGHLTLQLRRVPEVHAWLVQHLA
jgi:pimeloyl-ACP methyl ester carboxylesterase